MLEQNKKIILDLCGGTGSWSKPYIESGYSVHVITYPDYDINHTCFTDKFIIFNSGIWTENQLWIETKDIYGILVAPPCTMFSNARRNAKEPLDLKGAMKTVQSCFNVVHNCLYYNHIKSNGGLKFWALENPHTGYLKRFLGKPALVFDPCDYGDPYTKKTALWGEFNNPKYNRVEPNKTKIHKTGKTDYATCVEHLAKDKIIPEGYKEKTKYPKRKILRSMTPQGFATAFFTANK